ncbi:hypothetical protein A2419_03155 [Candidatus Adlerbacteria bacterium RIFOXYC1_FULL_48_26]|uniref:Uncharacterized protein n=1 Tax=Candidatus Adlerbacteria bacterium RIFOXYC1_FULL_48_26 TaxID=1797247 RepID=A0A1F4Y4C5_9BACT|nr:MAG: hypothetical protein A2419_03155 [Candidatus Adlerbacteria bacterium RIFOXYC1_FULL_48_26]OGC94510.1 MAG: hypothetical protein A2389_01315 [Candidatus Adlerbacteria bacterium RIFOXYB1_FULL_48_10]OGC94982.1 MAG: hypothetical protein A2590_02780 [Candidatus Adlerbacteria bacterium RIFOXYD1_FULL_48_8]
MHTARNSLLILFAILLDILQAGISAGLFMMGAFPGTVGGAAGGCFIGAKVAGSVGCAIGGTVAGFAGSVVNVASAATLPFAVGLGFAVNFCISATLGVILVAWLWSLGMYKFGPGITGFIVELTPGLAVVPGWTMMTILCVVRKTAEEKKLVGSTGSLFTTFATTGIAGAGAFAAFAINQGTARRAREAGVFTQEEQDQNLAEKKQFVSTELKNIDGIRAKNQAYAA